MEERKKAYQMEAKKVISCWVHAAIVALTLFKTFYGTHSAILLLRDFIPIEL